MKSTPRHPVPPRGRRHLLKAALAAVLAAAAAPAAAQAVRGQVVFRNGAPAAGVSVRVVSTQIGPSRPVLTGYDGMYHLGGIPPGNYRLEVSVNGQPAPPRNAVVFARPTTDLPRYVLPW